MPEQTKTTYITSKEECEKNISGVCEGCGGKLSAIETVDNAGRPTFWQGCESCCSFRSGIDQKYFQVARKLVESGELLPYSHMHRDEYEGDDSRMKYFLDSQTAGLSHSIRKISVLLSNNPQTTRPKNMKWDERDNIILKLLDFTEHGKSCSFDRPSNPVCDCGLQKLIEQCEEFGYGG